MFLERDRERERKDMSCLMMDLGYILIYCFYCKNGLYFDFKYFYNKFCTENIQCRIDDRIVVFIYGED